MVDPSGTALPENRQPPSAVLSAFGAVDPPYPLDGGQGETWRSGEIVLKPAGDPVETAWRAEVLDGLEETTDFRVARPVRARDGSWIVDGWESWHVVVGKEDHHRPDDVLRVAEAFHAAIAELPRPSFLDTRDDPWTHADRMAWDETDVTEVSGSDRAMPLLERLAGLRRPVDLPAQPVHGDLLGNVLFADDLPPAVIDWPVYYRPAAWAAAVVVVDALCWYAASPDLLDRWSHLPEWSQMLVRALIYRLATDDALSGAQGPDPRALDAYRRVSGLLEARI